MANAEADPIELLVKHGPEFRGLVTSASTEAIGIGGSPGEPDIKVERYQDSWEVVAEEGHGHLDTADEAIQLAVRLLRGEARFGQEYRGDTLAATWIEKWDGEAFEIHHRAMFLSPFDLDEWTLWPGEGWHQVTITRKWNRLLQRLKKSELKTHSEESVFANDMSAAWFLKAMPRPTEGMKWVVTSGGEFVFEAPKGWRNSPVKEEGHMVLAPRLADMTVRAYSYFRDCEQPASEPVARAVRPYSVDKVVMPPQDGWCLARWELLFSDGQSAMLGIVEASARESLGAAFEDLCGKFDHSLKSAVFVQGEWGVGEIGESVAVNRDG